jgi:hypothetical protein
LSYQKSQAMQGITTSTKYKIINFKLIAMKNVNQICTVNI